MALTQKVGTSYKHTQSSASDTWTVTHNLGMYPAIDVLVDISGNLTKIIPMSVTYTNENECSIAFSTERSGVAIAS